MIVLAFKLSIDSVNDNNKTWELLRPIWIGKQFTSEPVTKVIQK